MVESIERGRSRSSIMIERVRLSSSLPGIVGAVMVLAVTLSVLEGIF